MSYTLVLVESPAKARTIERYLGPGYRVKATRGHLRDLPANAREAPEHIRHEPWAGIGIHPDTLTPHYVIRPDHQDDARAIQLLARDARDIIFGMDGDREGEGIAWHAAHLVGVKRPLRMVFHEVTQPAILTAIQPGNLRPLDMNLVRAQETRRLIDRLVGYTLSGRISRAMRLERLSAGRVQDMALMVLAQRENERMKFRPAELHTLKAEVRTGPAAPPFTAQVSVVYTKRHPEGQPLARKSHFTHTGELKPVKDGPPPLHLSTVHAEALAQSLHGPATVTEVQQEDIHRSPGQPFTTVSLQRGAARLGLDPATTTQLAQALYDGGYITYPRTDSPTLSQEATQAARNQAVRLFGPDSVPPEPSRYHTRNATAQEAHEAIRPAGNPFRSPAEVDLDGDQLALYTLIFNRTVASQMTDATSARTRITLRSGKATLTAQGRVLLSPGFTRLYADEDATPPAEDSPALPAVTEGQPVTVTPAPVQVERTSPPARFESFELIEALEKMGIGRPSTYGPILDNLTSRQYAAPHGRHLAVTARGLLKISYLLKNLPELVSTDFTADMEAGLDDIAAGTIGQAEYLAEFWTDELAPRLQGHGDHPPAVTLHHLDATLDLSITRQESASGSRPTGEIHLVHGTRRAALPETVIPAELTPEDLPAIFNGSWKPPPARKRTRNTTGGTKETTPKPKKRGNRAGKRKRAD